MALSVVGEIGLGLREGPDFTAERRWLGSDVRPSSTLRRPGPSSLVVTFPNNHIHGRGVLPGPLVSAPHLSPDLSPSSFLEECTFWSPPDVPSPNDNCCLNVQAGLHRLPAWISLLLCSVLSLHGFGTSLFASSADLVGRFPNLNPSSRTTSTIWP